MGPAPQGYFARIPFAFPHHIGQLSGLAPRRTTGRWRRLTTTPFERSAVAALPKPFTDSLVEPDALLSGRSLEKVLTIATLGR